MLVNARTNNPYEKPLTVFNHVHVAKSRKFIRIDATGHVLHKHFYEMGKPINCWLSPRIHIFSVDSAVNVVDVNVVAVNGGVNGVVNGVVNVVGVSVEVHFDC